MDIIAFTSSKGGVGKSSLAFNTAGALALMGKRTVLVDEDARIHTCLDWAAAASGSLPFQVTDPVHAAELTRGADILVVDTEGRPELADMVELTRTARLALIPCGPSGVEVRSTLALWAALQAGGANMAHLKAVITKAPPVGTVGQQAREALRELGVTACDAVVRQYSAHQRAAEMGLLVRDVPDPRAASAWADIVELAEEISV